MVTNEQFSQFINKHKEQLLLFEYVGGGMVFVTDESDNLLMTLDDDVIDSVLGSAVYAQIRTRGGKVAIKV